MLFKDIVSVIFDENDLKGLDNSDIKIDLYEWILEYGTYTKKFLYLDYRGEEDYEIVNYILDYELKYDIELASQEELEQLGKFQYELVPGKIREVNKIISSKGYGLFSYPTTGDYYALFIAALENKIKLVQIQLLKNKSIPIKERYIQFYD
ncbi:hypothetical protein FC756_19170 [Lysinibacillus mangiferihumi]|uniref:Uncharacterized protein n=1 Tax=Lysinibacillus mangiferihumi TaxID=1130819 RepID=A0A4U2YMT0_9BACI|nr:hypothetical protein [Lysinibacillus mangiferihumi]TKI62134.1 hypothetical protein FC756_19170 [Lysinibacillus mangiferihumi]